MSAIFISHSSHDNAAAAALRSALDAAGYRSLFLDFHPEDGIPAGRNWETELYANLRACQAVVVLCSEHSMSSKWCFAEITHAKALGKEIFPVRLGPCTIDPILTARQMLDLSAAPAGDYTQLLRGFVAARLDPASVLGIRPDRSPYPGLLAFEEADAAVFFGRDAEVQQCLDLLVNIRRFSGARAVVLLGASGSGKSSVLKAGIVPRLRLKRGDWLVIDPFRPRSRPFQELALALANALKRCGAAADWRALRDRLEASPASALADTLVDLRMAAGSDAATPLLLIDQAEELEATASDAVLAAITAAVSDPALGAIALFTLRSDFFAAFQRQAVPAGLALQTVPIAAMPLERLPLIIEGPAERVALSVEPALTRQIVEDAELHALPMVAFALRELYEARATPTAPLALADYRDRLGGLDGAIARAAEAVVGASPLSARDVAELRHAFLRMVRVNDQEQYTRAPLPEAEVPEGARAILERFVQARLLVARADDGAGTTLEMAHESLLHAWARLRTWTDEDRAFIGWRTRLTSALTEWQRTPDALLRGVSLSEACEFLAARGADLSNRERGFIVESREAHEREQLRWQRAYETALSRQLAAQAEQLRAQRRMLERSVLLATEAMRRQPGAEADLTLRSGLTLLPDTRWRVALDTEPSAIAISPDASLIVTGNADRTVRLLDGRTGAERWRILHAGPVRSVAFSPDGLRVASGSDAPHDAAQIHDSGTGRQIAVLATPGCAFAVRFSPDGRLVATAPGVHVSSPPRPQDPYARVWDAASGALVCELPCKANAMAVAFSPDSALLGVRTESGHVLLFDIRTRLPKVQLPAPKWVAAITGIAFLEAGTLAVSPSGRLIAAADGSSGAVVWDTDTGALVATVGHSAHVTDLDFSADDAVLALAGSDGTARVWQLREQRDIVQVQHAAGVRGVLLLDDGSLATFSEDGTVSLWSARHLGYVRDNGRELLRIVHDQMVTSIALSGDQRFLASASVDGTVRLSHLTAGLHELRLADRREISDVAFSPDGTIVATCGTARTACWNAVSGDHLADVDMGAGSRVAFSPDQRHLAVVNSSCGILLAFPSLEACGSCKLGQGGNAVAFSPNSASVAFGGADDTVHVWDVAGARERLSVRLEREVLALAFSPDGLQIAVATGYRYTFHRPNQTEPRVCLIHACTGERLGELPYGGAVHDLAFSPDGTLLLTASGDRTAGLWDMRQCAQVASILHDAALTGVAFSPDGRHFATACGDRAVMVWDTATRKKMVRIVDPIRGDDAGRTAVAFSPDGRLLATAMGSAAYLWRWHAPDLIEKACRTLSRDLTPQEWEHNIGQEPYRRTRLLDDGGTTA